METRGSRRHGRLVKGAISVQFKCVNCFAVDFVLLAVDRCDFGKLGSVMC